MKQSERQSGRHTGFYHPPWWHCRSTEANVSMSTFSRVIDWLCMNGDLGPKKRFGFVVVIVVGLVFGVVVFVVLVVFVVFVAVIVAVAAAAVVVHRWLKLAVFQYMSLHSCQNMVGCGPNFWPP